MSNAVVETPANEKRFRHLLSTMPKTVSESFSSEQLAAIKQGMTETDWKKHPVDYRASISFFSYQYYLVFIAGRDQREMTREEIRFKRLALLTVIVTFLTISALFGILVLYLIKSAFGIDIFPNFSFGIWDWFQANFLT